MPLPPEAEREIGAYLLSQVIGLPEAIFHLLELGLTTFYSRTHAAPQRLTMSIPGKNTRARAFDTLVHTREEKYMSR